MKNNTYALLLFVILSFLSCKSTKEKMRAMQLRIITAQPLKPGKIPSAVVNLCRPVKISDTLFFNSNQEEPATILARLDNGRSQSMYVKTSDWLNGFIGGAPKTWEALNTVIGKKLSATDLDPVFTQPYPEAIICRRFADSVINKANSDKEPVLIFSPKSGRFTYAGCRVTSQPDSIPLYIKEMLSQDQQHTTFTVIYGLELTAPKITVPVNPKPTAVHYYLPAGTVIKGQFFCDPKKFNRYEKIANGKGGFTWGKLLETNSVACGYGKKAKQKFNLENIPDTVKIIYPSDIKRSKQP